MKLKLLECNAASVWAYKNHSDPAGALPVDESYHHVHRAPDDDDEGHAEGDHEDQDEEGQLVLLSKQIQRRPDCLAVITPSKTKHLCLVFL